MLYASTYNTVLTVNKAIVKALTKEGKLSMALRFNILPTDDGGVVANAMRQPQRLAG